MRNESQYISNGLIYETSYRNNDSVAHVVVESIHGLYTHALSENTSSWQNGTFAEDQVVDGAVSGASIVCLSIMFCLIGVVGILGNILVIYIILTDRKMRKSVTNLFIMNLALFDLLIMVFGIPEIVQFMINRGWLLGQVLCKVQRYILVFSLYASVLTLMAVCVERYIAIVHPIKAHIFCSRRRMMIVIVCIWPTVLITALPVLIFNTVTSSQPGHPLRFCSLVFPPPQTLYLMVFKYAEFLAFYLVPVIAQITCYAIIGKTLFAGTEQLHRKQVVINQDGLKKSKMSDALRQRKGVVKMLASSVVIYFISYSPHQVLLFYNTFSKAPFHSTWVFVVFVTAMGYINSAANPLLYCIFSQNFRTRFKSLILRSQDVTDQNELNHLNSTFVTKYTRVGGERVKGTPV